MSWRMDLAVLTDLSASMFAATFMILLIFLSLAQQKDARTAAPMPSIEATDALRITRREVLAPAHVIDLLRRHGEPAAGIGIDAFDDRVEVFLRGTGNPLTLRSPATQAGLARVLGPDGEGPVRLYVFSNALYNQILPVLERGGRQVLEITVPRALRDPARPAGGWSETFLSLSARKLYPAAFRDGLALLLGGDTSKSSTDRASAGGAAEAAGPTHPGTSLLERLRRWLQAVTTFVLPALGFLSIFLIERRRRGRMEMDFRAMR